MDPILTILGRLGLTDEADVFRDYVLQLDRGEPPSRSVLTLALMATLVFKSLGSRAAAGVVIRDMAPWFLERQFGKLKVPKIAVVLFDGTFLFVPSEQEGRLYQLPDLKPVEHGAIPPYLMMSVWDVSRAYEVCKET